MEIPPFITFLFNSNIYSRWNNIALVVLYLYTVFFLIKVGSPIKITGFLSSPFLFALIFLFLIFINGLNITCVFSGGCILYGTILLVMTFLTSFIIIIFEWISMRAVKVAAEKEAAKVAEEAALAAAAKAEEEAALTAALIKPTPIGTVFH